MEALRFLHQLLHVRRVDSPAMIWVRARGSEGMLPLNFYIKMVQSGAYECSKVRYYQPKIQRFMNNFLQ